MSAPIAVVTVTYSSGDYLHQFLASLPAATDQPVQVIIADNGSTDGAPEKAVQEHANVTLVHTGGNLGYGGGMNRGVAELAKLDGAAAGAGDEFLILANPDVIWTPGSIDELLAAARRHPRAGSLGPRVDEPTGEVYPSARSIPSPITGGAHAVLGKVWPSNPWTVAYRNENEDVRERTAGWLSGSCLLVRREAFDAIGGFDSSYFMFFEDVDLGDRLTKAGWENVYVPSAVVTHAKSHSVSKHPERMLTAHHDSAYRFFADRHQGALWAPARFAVKTGLNVRCKLEIAAALRAAQRFEER